MVLPNFIQLDVGRFKPRLGQAEKAVLKSALDQLVEKIYQDTSFPTDPAPRLTPSPLWLYCITMQTQFPVCLTAELEERFEDLIRQGLPVDEAFEATKTYALKKDRDTIPGSSGPGS